MSSRAVFDCMVFLQAAARKDGPAAACLQLARDRRLQLFVCLAILTEITDVLNRPRTRKKINDLTPENVETFVRDVQSNSMRHDDIPLTFRFERDPKDEPYLNLAIAVGADYLVTWDLDLLDLASADNHQAMAFRESFPTLRILTPVALLQQLQS